MAVEFDSIDAHLERTAYHSPFDVDGTCRRIDGIPIYLIQLILRPRQLVAEAVLRADAHRFP